MHTPPVQLVTPPGFNSSKKLHPPTRTQVKQQGQVAGSFFTSLQQTLEPIVPSLKFWNCGQCLRCCCGQAAGSRSAPPARLRAADPATRQEVERVRYMLAKRDKGIDLPVRSRVIRDALEPLAWRRLRAAGSRAPQPIRRVEVRRVLYCTASVCG